MNCREYPLVAICAGRRSVTTRKGLYGENPGSIDFLSEPLFRPRVPVPAGVTRGQYNVEVHLLRHSEVES